MSAKKLDKSKPHGVIYNDAQGRVYEQDGMYFHGDGTQWVDSAPKSGRAAPAPAPTAAPAAAPGDQLRQQMGE